MNFFTNYTSISRGIAYRVLIEVCKIETAVRLETLWKTTRRLQKMKNKKTVKEKLNLESIGNERMFECNCNSYVNE